MRFREKAGRLAGILYHYKRRHAVLPYMPIRLWVETTNSCNLRCKMCPNASDHTSVRGNMDIDLYRSIIRQAAGRINDINLSHRGEPLFHPQLEEMVKIASEAGLGTRIHTNATMLNRERARRLLESAPDLVSFSFDGFDKETYESVRIGACFEETMENIEAFLAERRRLGMSKPYTVIQIIEPWEVTEAYRRNLRHFGEKVRKMGLDKFYVKRPHNWAGNAPGAAGAGKTRIPCTFLFYSLTILWDGTVCPCPQDWYATMVLGNLNTQSIDDVWNGEPIRLLRQRMFRFELDGLLCDNCDRIRRNTWMGIPLENAKAFLGETLAGYRFVGRFIKK